MQPLVAMKNVLEILGEFSEHAKAYYNLYRTHFSRLHTTLVNFLYIFRRNSNQRGSYSTKLKRTSKKERNRYLERTLEHKNKNKLELSFAKLRTNLHMSKLY